MRQRIWTLIIEKVKSMGWKHGDSILSGDEMFSILTTASQIGSIVSRLWFAVIVSPRWRFPNSKALAIYYRLDTLLKISADHVTSTTKRDGNKQLHKALAQSGSRLVYTHNELFEKWGCLLFHQSDHWKKSANAVARKLAMFLYHMPLYGRLFSYGKYKLLKENVVLDFTVDILPSLNRDFKQ